MEVSREEILKALEQVIDPELKRNVVELDMVRDVSIDGSDVTVGIALTVAGCPLRSSFEEQVGRALAPVAGVERVALEFDVMTPEERSALTARREGHAPVLDPPVGARDEAADGTGIAGEVAWWTRVAMAYGPV